MSKAKQVKENSIEKQLVLRHDYSPYLVMGIPVIIVALAWSSIAILMDHKIFDGIVGFLIGAGLVLFQTCLGLSYRIWAEGDTLIAIPTWPNKPINLDFPDITKVKFESFLFDKSRKSQRAPVRIAFYGKTRGEGYNEGFIDVSLKHFNHDDILKLLDMIHEKRPDLEMPKMWYKQRSYLFPSLNKKEI